MRRLINAFTIKLALPFVFLWVNVPVYVSLHRTIKEKQVCFLLFIHNVQVSINDNE